MTSDSEPGAGTRFNGKKQGKNDHQSLPQPRPRVQVEQAGSKNIPAPVTGVHMYTAVIPYIGISSTVDIYIPVSSPASHSSLFPSRQPPVEKYSILAHHATVSRPCISLTSSSRFASVNAGRCTRLNTTADGSRKIAGQRIPLRHLLPPLRRGLPVALTILPCTLTRAP